MPEVCRLYFVSISTLDLNLHAEFVFVGVKSCKYSILLCTHIYWQVMSISHFGIVNTFCFGF